MSPNGIRPFQIALYAGFGALMLVALFLFTTFSGDGGGGGGAQNTYGAQVMIWGTLDQTAMNAVLRSISDVDEDFQVVKYREFSERDLADQLVRATSLNDGPDIILAPHTVFTQIRPYVYPIPYSETLNRRSILNRYIGAAQIYTLDNGLQGYPVAIDPLMMYWNRDLFATYGFVSPPETWQLLVAQTVPAITQAAFDRTINLSAVAFGEYRNIENPFAIISALMIQGGSQLVSVSDNRYEIKLNRSANGGQPLEQALTFYTGFANPNNPLYSWNRSLPSDRDLFAAEDLALYFGYGSEAELITRLNPNLNFDLTEVPQDANATVRFTYGDVYGLFLTNTAARNNTGAWNALQLLQQYDKQIADAVAMAPAGAANLAAGHPDPVQQQRYTAALVARGWLNPNQNLTEDALQTAIESVVSGRVRSDEAARDFEDRLQRLY